MAQAASITYQSTLEPIAAEIQVDDEGLEENAHSVGEVHIKQEVGLVYKRPVFAKLSALAGSYYDDNDASISKRPVWFHLFDLSRPTLRIDFNLYCLQICLLHNDLESKLIIFDPGGCWSSLVLQNMLDGRRILISLFANIFCSIYNPKVSIVITHVCILVDCVLSNTLEDKGVFKGKEDMVHVGFPCRLHHTIFLWFFSTSSWINILTYVFNPSGLHCQCAIWDDCPHSFWLIVVISLALSVCQGRGDCVLIIHSIICTMKLGGKHLTTTCDIFMIMTISFYICEGELNGKHAKYRWSLCNTLNMYFNSINVRTNKSLPLLTHVFDMSILCRQGSLWSGHPYNSCLSFALSLTWCLCKRRSDIGDIANSFEEASTFSMAWCMNMGICLNIASVLTTFLYLPKPLHQGSGIAEFECEKGYEKLDIIVSFSLIIAETFCSEVFMCLHKAYWFKRFLGHIDKDLSEATTHLPGIPSTWLAFATSDLVNESLLLEVTKVRRQWRPDLLLKYSVRHYTHTILVFDPGGWYRDTRSYLAVRLSTTKLILEDKDHFMGSVMIHTKISWRAD